MKTYGKHQVPMFSEEEKEGIKVGAEQTEGKRSRILQPKEGTFEQKSASAVNKIALSNSLIVRRISPIQPKGAKLTTPPTNSLPNATNNGQNLRKSASTPSLGTKPPPGTADQLQPNNDFGRTVPNVAQMLLAAREQEKQMPMTSPRTIGMRLPPLQLPNGPKKTEKMEMREKEEDDGQGMIATVATRPFPRLQPLRQGQIGNGTENPTLAPQSVDLSPDHGAELTCNSSQISEPIANVSPNQCLVNFQKPPRRRPSSADAVVTTVHRPLPAISTQFGAKRHGMLSLGGHFAKRRANRFRCRATVKCALVGGFFSVSVFVFALLLLLSSDGVGPRSAEVSSPSPQSKFSAAPSTTAASATSNLPIAAPTDVNIVGGAIFQPISMQNVSGENKL